MKLKGWLCPGKSARLNPNPSPYASEISMPAAKPPNEQLEEKTLGACFGPQL
jgi:hypothetical protein